MCVASAVLDPLEVGLSLRGEGPSDISLGRCRAPALQASITEMRIDQSDVLLMWPEFDWTISCRPFEICLSNLIGVSIGDRVNSTRRDDRICSAKKMKRMTTLPQTP